MSPSSLLSQAPLSALPDNLSRRSPDGTASGNLFVLPAPYQQKSIPRFGMSLSLHEAVETGDLGVVKKWIEQLKPEQLNAPGPNHASPLWTAVFQGHSKIVQALIDAKADIDQVDQKNGWTPLMAACMTGHPEIAEQLAEAGADVNLQEPELGLTPLLIAIHQGYDALAEKLIRKGASVTQANNLGQTPMLVASFKGNQPLVRQLLRAGAGSAINQSDHAYPLPLYQFQ